MNDTLDSSNGPLGRQWDETYRNGKWEMLRLSQLHRTFGALA